VVRRQEKWLMIRRSALVRAPRKLCFPGGAIEPGESELAAVARELREELGAESTPIACIWRSLTSWNVALAWCWVDLPPDLEFAANPQEVEEVHWLSTEEALAHPDLLESARDFFLAWERGEIPRSPFGPSSSSP
jgi:8-oxo-dGTP pyrophosphatase MutT (NUDIX family)